MKSTVHHFHTPEPRILGSMSTMVLPGHFFGGKRSERVSEVCLEGFWVSYDVQFFPKNQQL